MKKSHKLLTCLMLLSTLALVCFPVPEVKAATLTLDIITPHWEGITTEYERAFNDYYFGLTGDNVTINWIDVGGTSDIVAYVNAAFAANSETTSNIDIWWGGGVDPFIAQKALDHLVSYQVNATILNNVATNISGIPVYDTMNHTWYGTALSGFGIIYNKQVLSLEGLPVPTTWEDLADPQLEGWVGSADPRHSGSTHMAYEIMMQAYGWEEGFKIATMLGANVKTWPTSSSAVPKSVSAGDVAYGLAIDFYAWSEISKHGADKLGYVLPEALTVVNPDSIAILKGAPHLNLSKAFVDFTLTEAAQKLWMLPKGHADGPQEFLLGRLCVWPSLYTELANDTVVPTNPFEVSSQLEYNATLGSIRYSLLNDLIGSMIIDTQSDLVAVWGEIFGINTTLTEAGVTSTYIDDAVSKMGELPITEAEGNELAEEWNNATLRNEKITEWHTFALSKYTNASSLAKLAATELADYFNDLLAQLEAEKTNNLYMGLGGGAIIGIVIGAIVVYFMGRQKEIAEVKR